MRLPTSSAKDLRRWRYIQSCSSLCRRVMFYGTSDRDSSSRSFKQSLRQTHGVSPAATSGSGDVHPRRHVVRSRRLIHVRSRLELGGLVASRQSPVRRRKNWHACLCRVQSVCALREIPLPHYPVCSNSVCFVSWGTLPRVAPSEIVSAPPELHIIDISPSGSGMMRRILVTIIDVLVGVVQPHDNRFVGGKLDGARVHAQELECAFRPARQRICVGGDIQSCSSLCRRVMFYGTSDRDSSSRSQQSLRSRTASARRRIRGGDVHPRRHVVRSRRLIHVRSRLELGGLVASPAESRSPA